MELRNIEIRKVGIKLVGTPSPSLAPTPPSYPAGTFVSAAGATYNNLVTTPSVSGPFAGVVSTYYALDPGGYVAVAPNANWAPGTDDFTIEWFQKGLGGSALYPRIFTVGAYPSSSIAVTIESGIFYFWTNGSLHGGFGMSISDNIWHHVAICRTNTNDVFIYVDGVLKQQLNISGTANITNSVSQLNLFGESTDINTTFHGYITNFRWCNGVKVYSGTDTGAANFVVPTSALTQTASANPYGGSNTAAITSGQCKLLMIP